MRQPNGVREAPCTQIHVPADGKVEAFTGSRFVMHGDHPGGLDETWVMQNRQAMMTEPAELSDEDLLDRAHQLRLLALRGHLDARGPAHEHEREVRRRFGSENTTMGAPLQSPARKRPFWKFWKFW